MNDYDVIVIGRAGAALEVNIPNYVTAIVTTNEAVDSHVLGTSPAYATTAPSSQNR
jgi:hypothetical protein